MRQNLDEIKTVLENHNYSIETIIINLMEKFKLKAICKNVCPEKQQGFSVIEIMMLILIMPLMSVKTVHSFYNSYFNNLTEMKKDTIYRLKNNENMPWRSILYSITKKFKMLVKNETENSITALIVDDTIDVKTGRHIENVTFVHDHAAGKSGSKLGFKNLFLAYFDGKSIVPVDFTIQKEKKLSLKKRKEQFEKKLDSKSDGLKRRKEASVDKITNALVMKRAVKNGYVPKYVLSDSWFTSFNFVKTIRNIKNGEMHVVAGIKKDKRKYSYAGSDLNAKEIIQKLRSEGKEKRNRNWNLRYYEVTVKYGEIGDVKLFICRFPYQKEWRVFISTDLKLDTNKMLEVYSVRWTIEVMFKELKQCLSLGKCQSRDFDAHIAQVTISCILYVFLSYLKRTEDYETIGGILEILKKDVIERTLAERIWELFENLLESVINVISKSGCMDISKFKKSQEYEFLKELFESSFLGNQLKSAS